MALDMFESRSQRIPHKPLTRPRWSAKIEQKTQKTHPHHKRDSCDRGECMRDPDNCSDGAAFTATAVQPCSQIDSSKAELPTLPSCAALIADN